MTRLAVIDYEAGNLTSVMKALRAAGADPFLTSDAGDLQTAGGIVIPGVGHFAATAAIGAAMRQRILEAAREGLPILGICLGLQYLFAGSEEAPDVPGLGLLRGRCVRLSGDVKVPHVGWNTLTLRPSRLLGAVDDGAYVYFTHSYAAPVTEATVATSAHGIPFAAAVEQQNLFGVQFHPEKSSGAGLAILRSFIQITRSADRPIAR